MGETNLVNWHGILGLEHDWELPTLTRFCEDKSRPEYTDISSHEYTDTDTVLAEKIKILAQLIKQSQNCVAYTGAGLSVASGLDDYATKSEESISSNPHVSGERGSGFLAFPNLGHKVVAQLHYAGYVKKVINQNHDGLLQKAGLPQYAINEIHGSWFDPSNPGEFILRDDLIEEVVEWEKKTDLCLALGTSLSGLNSDRIAKTPAKKYPKKGFGLIIVAIQATQLDSKSTLRIFAKLNDVMRLLAQELGLEEIPQPIYKDNGDIFTIPYNQNGDLSENKTCTLKLTEGSRIKVTKGNFKGCKGTVEGKNELGHYKVRVFVPVKDLDDVVIPYDWLLGSWWLEEAQKGLVPYVPVVQDRSFEE
jgi:NAD-dependent SIR2 family protein deacetylase